MNDIKFMVDVNVEKGIVDYLLGKGYDVKWIPGYDCEIFDEDLLTLANNEKRVLIANDKDFGEIIFLQKKLFTGIILLRVKGQRVKDRIRMIEKLLQHYCDKLLGCFIVITNKNIRFIPLEDIK